MKVIALPLNRILAALVFASLVGASAFGQKGAQIKSTKTVDNAIAGPAASVAPVVFDGQNINCADLNALHVNGSGDIRFSHIITNDEMKLNFGDPNGTFPFTNGSGRIVIGTEYPTRSVTISSSSNPGTVASWSSQLPITAVNVKVGNTSYVYPYKPFALSDTNLATGDARGISHVTFCFGEPVNPTAAEVSLSGRVVDANGIGISKAQMVLVRGMTGEVKIALTNAFGYYSFDGLDITDIYVLNVSHKRFGFAGSQRVVSLNDNLTDVDFVAQPNQ